MDKKGAKYLFTINSKEPFAEPDDMTFWWRILYTYFSPYYHRGGPPAPDVANDGRMALMDPVNERIIIFNPNEGSYSSFAMPFTDRYYADLAFDQEDRLMVCDYQGEEVVETLGPDPYCYLLLPDGKLGESTPVYVRSPSYITKDLKILDYSDSKLDAPFNSQGQANSREAQRRKGTWGFPKRYVEGMDPFVAHYADLREERAFEVRSVSPLGVLTDFEKTPQGYIITFSLGDRIRKACLLIAIRLAMGTPLPAGKFQLMEGRIHGHPAPGWEHGTYLIQ